MPPPPPAPLSPEERAAVRDDLLKGLPPQAALARLGRDPLTFSALVAADAALAADLAEVDARRRENVLNAVYVDALKGSRTDRTLFLKRRPPAAPTPAGPAVTLDAPLPLAALPAPPGTDPLADPEPETAPDEGESR